MPIDVPVLLLANVAEWARYLAREAGTSKGVWLTLAKKGVTNPTSLTYVQALDEALCYGWIDGQTRRRDDRTYSHRFTPRTAKSGWSQRNIGHIARLESEGRMQPRGRLEVEKAKADGRWDAAYPGQATIEASPDLLAALAKVPEAQGLWDILTKKNRFAICFRIHNTKTEAGRQRRIAAFVDMLASGQTPHPQKQSRVTSKPEPPPLEKSSSLEQAQNLGKASRRSMRLQQSSSVR